MSCSRPIGRLPVAVCTRVAVAAGRAWPSGARRAPAASYRSAAAPRVISRVDAHKARRACGSPLPGMTACGHAHLAVELAASTAALSWCVPRNVPLCPSRLPLRATAGPRAQVPTSRKGPLWRRPGRQAPWGVRPSREAASGAAPTAAAPSASTSAASKGGAGGGGATSCRAVGRRRGRKESRGGARAARCGEEGCTRQLRRCSSVDMPRFGGPGSLRQACVGYG